MTTALKPNVTPFAFASPDLPRLITSDSDLSAHSDLAEVAVFARAHATEAATLAAQLAEDASLSDMGRRQKFTAAMTPVLRRAMEHRTALDAAAASIETEAATLEQNAANPPAAAPIVRQERLALAESVGRLSPTERTKAIEAAVTGNDPALAEALAFSHRLVTGIAEPIQQLLREQFTNQKVDHAARARLTTRATLLREARTLLDIATGAIESAADRSVLKEARVATLRRSDLSDTEKATYISQHGLAAFKALPA